MLKRSKEILKAAYLIALGVLKNRYGATIVLALGWVIFISDIDLGFIIQEQIELNKMKSEVRSTIKKNDELILKLIELDENPKVLERIARERYFMKKPLEEVYRIVD
tara:strand:- start:1046 stop:1366 length:321 start_codon:yes stop_codon:yes gene_type:complete